MDSILPALLIRNNLEQTTSDRVWYDDILVNRTGDFEKFLGSTCNRGYVVQCDMQDSPESISGVQSGSFLSIMVLIVVIVISLILVVVVLICLGRKKKALGRELEALRSRSENLTAFQDYTHDGDRP